MAPREALPIPDASAQVWKKAVPRSGLVDLGSCPITVRRESRR
jgi:hypothetical protein